MGQRSDTPFIEGFERIAPSIYFRRPKCTEVDYTSESTMSLHAPDLILLFSWTGAKPQHISKYIDNYIKMFPSTHIMVVTTAINDLIYRSSCKKQNALLPAIDAIVSQRDNILVHCFSEGGSHKAVQFAKAFLKRTGQKLPISTLCLDSTPGNPRYLMLADAFKKSLPPNAVIRFVGMLGAYTILASLWSAYIFIGPSKNIITRTRRSLDNAQLWDTQAPRCYLFSKADSLIYWEDIEEHGKHAAMNGSPVTMVRFANSAHCCHAKEDEKKYWDAVGLTWDSKYKGQ